MFKNEYQGGPFFEIFSAQGKNPGAKWKIFGSPSVIGKEFDREVKGFVFVLEGSSQTNKMQLPKETRQTLGLIQQFLVLQIYVPLGQDFSTELLITDLGNIKRRLYLSTVHKELSVTPLHAKIPLFMIKRKIWCNLCIDLVAFTSEIFKGAVFQSLDGIIVSANCKLRKIFTLKSKPLDTTDEVADEPTDTIPRACQLNSDVPQVTQLLNMNKLRPPEQKCGSRPLTSPELVDHLMNRGSVTLRNTRNQDVSHIAFGSKVLGPPPPSGRKFSTRASGEVAKSGSIQTNRSCQLPVLAKRREPMQDTGRSERSPSPFDMALDQGNKENIHHMSLGKDEWIFPDKECSHLDSSNRSPMTCEVPYDFLTSALSGDQVSESKQAAEDPHEDIFTFSSKPRLAPHGKPLNLSSEGCSFSADLKEEISGVWRGAQMEDDFYGSESNEDDDSYNEFVQEAQNLQASHFLSGSPEPVTSKDIHLKRASRSSEQPANKGYAKQSSEEALSPRKEESVVGTGKAENFQNSILPTCCLSPPGNTPESCKKGPDKSKGRSTSQLRTSISRKSLKEIPQDSSNLTVQTLEYNWKNYQPSSMSASELQMLASMKRQQNEELEDNGTSHGLSASQIDNCNISISTSSDDTTTWNSCLPAPVNQGCHYQKEMNPLSHSNPRDWLSVFSPPIIPPSQQLAEHAEMPSHLTSQDEGDFGAEEDEVLTLLYDPCLNCYFDPETGKYYELA
ncbi:protein CFAP20DC [Tiliqua scincoides]|uniref:protein CFAP20DC n=1 Tax=Tiliqua scincoides TaxID=71010 RepID=UPI0034618339